MQLTMPEKKTVSSRRPLFILLGLLVLAGIGLAVWQNTGCLTFDGELRHRVTPVPVPGGGRVLAVEVREGQSVRRGQVLLALDDAPLRRALLEERERLNQLTLALPPQHQYVPAEGRGDGGREETLTARLERRRKVEDAAWQRVREASDNEAQAAVLYNRSVMLTARGKLPQEQRDAAEAALRAAQQEKQAAQEAFEQVSLSRAETSADIRSLRATQNAIGADRLPVEMRLQAYHNGLERVAAAEAALASALVLAPEDGVVAGVMLRPGDVAGPMQTALTLGNAGGLPVVAARLPVEQGKKLDTGRPCRVTPKDGGGKSYDGYIAAVVPDGARDGDPAGTDFVQVRVALLENAAAEKETPTALAEGGKASVTVLLRKELIREPRAVPGTGRNAGQSDTEDLSQLRPAPDTPAGQAAPPSSPLSVQTPFGGPAPERPAQESPARATGPVTVTTETATPAAANATGPEQATRTPEVSLPQLPPMKAPTRLTGSPYPDPRNNPSLATPEHLDRVGEVPR